MNVQCSTTANVCSVSAILHLVLVIYQKENVPMKNIYPDYD